MRMLARAAVLCACVTGCRPPVPEPPPSERIEVEVEAEQVCFAVIGDYGSAGPAEAAVAALVHGWAPDFIITLGDNNYPDGEADTIDANIGQYYHDYIAPYRGTHGEGASTNRFFPTLGNHDWRTADLAPYLGYFTLPGNERYYDVRWGPVHLFALDNSRKEPDGRSPTSLQAAWFKGQIQSSKAPWKIAYMHQAPYTSGLHGPTRSARWPYHAWGAAVVLAGHDHIYERIERDEGIYIVNGLGGHPNVYGFRKTTDGSVVRYNAEHGAMQVRADARTMTLQFIDVNNVVVDAVVLRKRDGQIAREVLPVGGQGERCP